MEYDLNLREYWRVVRKRKFIVIFSAVAMGIFSLGMAYLKKPVPVYETTAAVQVEKSSTATGLYLEVLSWSGADYLETQAEIIVSYPIIEKAAKEIGLIPKHLDSHQIRQNSEYMSAVLELKGKLTAEREGRSNLINVTAQDTDPKMAQKIANTVARVYLVEHSDEVNKRTLDSRRFIEDQIKRVGQQLREAEERLREFRERHKFLALGTLTSRVRKQYTAAEAKYVKLMKSIEEMAFMLNRLKAAKNDNPISTKESFQIDGGPPLYKDLNTRLVSLSLERDKLLLTYTEESRKVKEIDSQIHGTTEKMIAQLEEGLSTGETSARDMKAELDGYEQELDSLPDKALTLARLERDVKQKEQVVSFLESKLQEAKIREAARIEEVVIVKPALENTTPIKSADVQIKTLVGVVIGFIIGLVFAFIYETLDTSIGAITEIEEFVGASVLGVIPVVDMKKAKETLQEAYEKEDLSDHFFRQRTRLISHFIPNSTVSESYRAVRTNIQFAELGNEPKTIAFTSAVAKEGKSTTVVNTAITMAQAQKKVLLIEGDLRRPTLHRWFGVDQSPGLSEVILGSYAWRDTVRTITDIMLGDMDVEELTRTPGLDNLHMIPCGHIPPNPAELVGSEGLDRFLAEAKEEYDVLMIDLPPILSAADSPIICSKADAVVIVYKAGSTARGALRRARDQLKHVRANLIGVVLNELRPEVSQDYSDIGYYYGYSYGEREEPKGKWDSLLMSLKNIYKPKGKWDSLLMSLKNIYKPKKDRKKIRKQGAKREGEGEQ